ncbi:MAG: GTPase [Candidatus Odinarchaeia archaeon]
MENKNALICYLKTNVHDHVLFKIKIAELTQLVKTLGFKIVDTIIQTRIKQTSSFLFGKGKIMQIRDEVANRNISTVIFYNTLSSKQRLNLSKVLNCMVIDRIDIVLELFKRGASDKLSLLQIEYAELKRLMPYYKLISHEKFIREHAFFRSKGEYAYHNKMRAHHRRLGKLNNEINYYFFIKENQIEKRKELNKPIVCISGYYNAGKTTLFNKLTGESKEVSSRPFTTLTSKYQTSILYDGLLFVDTIGFVSDMDLGVLKSFSLNMLDIQTADLVIFAVSLEDDLDTIKFKIKQGLKIYQELNIDLNKLLILFTKLDLLNKPDAELYMQELHNFCTPYQTMFMSNINNTQIHQFLDKLKKILKPVINKHQMIQSSNFTRNRYEC